MPRRHCVYCANSVDAWIPYRIRAADYSDFLARVGVVGSNVERFTCPRCGSTDRERHLRLFLERLGWLVVINGSAVLHMAPEPRLSALIQSHGPHVYVKGDLFPSDPAILRIDLERVPYPDETFDVVIANHMLEHVRDPRAALSEMYRILRPGGRAICQTPFASRLTRTLEEPLLQSEEDRLFLYAQADHVRLFGLDIAEVITRAGFVGRLVPHDEILPDVDPERFGINELEPFFDFVRPTRGLSLA